MRTFAALALSLLTFSACAVDDSSPDDAEAQDAQAESSPAASGKADGAALAVTGLYTSHATTHRSGDILSLQLVPGTPVTPDTRYVRERCYHASCALPVPETDTYDTITLGSGKTYLRFWSFTLDHDAAGNLVPTPALADVYEIKMSGTHIKLRKSSTSRWFALYPTTANDQCTATGGTPSADGCSCPLNAPGTFAVQTFVPGAGGCIASPGANESSCDDSNGSWTDDDATLIGAYCTCGVGRYDDASGACATI